MSSILIAQANDHHMKPQALRGMFRLRDEVFNKRLGWDVKSCEDMEKDEYDDLNPVYFIARDAELRVHGCCRLLPTTGPYMLRDIFPLLLRGEPVPQDPNVCELSRFVIRPTSRYDCRQANFSGTTFEMLQNLVDYAKVRGIHSYVFVTSVALERMLRKIGIPLRRFGDQQAIRFGKVLSVACWMEINEETWRAVHGDVRNTQILQEAA